MKSARCRNVTLGSCLLIDDEHLALDQGALTLWWTIMCAPKGHGRPVRHRQTSQAGHLCPLENRAGTALSTASLYQSSKEAGLMNDHRGIGTRGLSEP